MKEIFKNNLLDQEVKTLKAVAATRAIEAMREPKVMCKVEKEIVEVRVEKEIDKKVVKELMGQEVSQTLKVFHKAFIPKEVVSIKTLKAALHS